MCFTVPTPQDSEEGPDNGARTSEASANLNDVEDWWIIEHARQVLFHNGSGIPSRHETVTFHVIISHIFCCTGLFALLGFKPQCLLTMITSPCVCASYFVLHCEIMSTTLFWHKEGITGMNIPSGQIALVSRNKTIPYSLQQVF